MTNRSSGVAVWLIVLDGLRLGGLFCPLLFLSVRMRNLWDRLPQRRYFESNSNVFDLNSGVAQPPGFHESSTDFAYGAELDGTYNVEPAAVVC